MKLATIPVLLSLFCMSCGHTIVRTGYEVRKSDMNDCPIVVTRDITTLDSLEMLGSVELLHPGSASQACNEARALRRLRREGCAVGADVIHLAEERWPEYAGECYECMAVFYAFSDSLYVPHQALNVEYRKNVEAIQRRTTKTVLRIIGGALAFLSVSWLIDKVHKR